MLHQQSAHSTCHVLASLCGGASFLQTPLKWAPHKSCSCVPLRQCEFCANTPQMGKLPGLCALAVARATAEAMHGLGAASEGAG